MSNARPLLQKFESANQGLAAELELLDAVCDTADSAVLVWQTNQSLVVPATFARTSGFQPAAERSAQRGWPVALRPTGGGTTPQGPGILNVALALRSDSRARMTIDAAYRAICAPLQDAFAELGLRTTCQAVPGSFCDGRYNIVLNKRKLAGTAQRWRLAVKAAGHHILAHALILHSADVAAVTQAINAFHSDLGMNDPVLPAVHTTLADTGSGIGQEQLARLLHKHLQNYIGDSATKENTAARTSSGSNISYCF